MVKRAFFPEIEAFDIFNRFRKRDFSGNTGQAIKNSTWQTITTFTTKVLTLIFTVVLARLLLPELFGLYSLALSTILLFSSFADLGVGQTLIKYLSSSKSEKKSKAYFDYLFKVRIILVLSSCFLLLVLARFIAYNYYGKPIFFALVAGVLYIFIVGFVVFFSGIFIARNDFRRVFYRDFIFQVSRIIFVPLIILFTISYFSTEALLGFIILMLSVSYLFSLVYVFVCFKKDAKFLSEEKTKFSKEEKKKINGFVLALSAVTLSTMFFGYIDMFILGRFVEGEFIGFYSSALSLISSVTPLITFSGALFPLFSKLKGKRLERGMKKSVIITLMVSIPLFLIILIFASLIVRIIYGSEYLLAINILRIFSVLIIIGPLIAMYTSYLVSQNKPKIVTQALVFASVLNVILNYTLIVSLLPYGMIWAVYGATIATIISKVFYLGLLVSRK